MMVYTHNDQTSWHEGGTVVQHVRGDVYYVHYRDPDDFHEEVSLPDGSVVFRKKAVGVCHRVSVTPDMLPSL
tara:strand:- start:210 stop:425 length:216 start_codon:yes stop_codon:yes gene_type:complete